jgi:hypothetical protein
MTRQPGGANVHDATQSIANDMVTRAGRGRATARDLGNAMLVVMGAAAVLFVTAAIIVSIVMFQQTQQVQASAVGRATALAQQGMEVYLSALQTDADYWVTTPTIAGAGQDGTWTVVANVASSTITAVGHDTVSGMLHVIKAGVRPESYADYTIVTGSSTTLGRTGSGVSITGDVLSNANVTLAQSFPGLSVYSSTPTSVVNAQNAGGGVRKIDYTPPFSQVLSSFPNFYEASWQRDQWPTGSALPLEAEDLVKPMTFFRDSSNPSNSYWGVPTQADPSINTTGLVGVGIDFANETAAEKSIGQFYVRSMWTPYNIYAGMTPDQKAAITRQQFMDFARQDPTWNANGWATPELTGRPASISARALNPDGSNVIYVGGDLDVYVTGVISKSVTIVSERDIYIIGSITRAANTTATVGLIAKRNIYICGAMPVAQTPAVYVPRSGETTMPLADDTYTRAAQTSATDSSGRAVGVQMPNDVTIQADLMAVGGSIIMDPASTSGLPSTFVQNFVRKRGTLTINGSLVAAGGITGGNFVSDAASTGGFTQTIIGPDTQAGTTPPPLFPQIGNGSLKVGSWNEYNTHVDPNDPSLTGLPISPPGTYGTGGGSSGGGDVLVKVVPAGGDDVKPVTTSNAEQAYNNAAVITLSAADQANTGAGTVWKTWYQISGDPNTYTGDTVVIPPAPANTVTTYTVTYWSEDLAGNIESPKSSTFTVTGADTIPSYTTVQDSNNPSKSLPDGYPQVSDPPYTVWGDFVPQFTSTDGGLGASGVNQIWVSMDVNGVPTFANDWAGSQTPVNFAPQTAPVVGSVQLNYKYFSYDKAGNREATRTLTVTQCALDTLGPIMTQDAPASGLFVGNAVIHLTADDGPTGQGVANIKYSVDNGDWVTVTNPTITQTMVTTVTISAPTSGQPRSHTLTFVATDAARDRYHQPAPNTGNPQMITFLVGPPLANDTTPPQSSSDAQSSYIGPATINLYSTDTGGVAAIYSQLDTGTVQTGATVYVDAPWTGSVTHQLRFWAVDNAGNVETAKLVTFVVYPEQIPPTTSAYNQALYNYSPALFQLTAVDNDGGSGLKTTYYSIDGAAVQTGTTNPLGVTWVSVSGDGNHRVDYHSVDNAGNVELTKTATFTIDTTPPKTSTDATSTTYSGQAVIHLTASDVTTAGPGSGVAYTHWRNVADGNEQTTNPILLGPGTSTVQYWSVDNAGNIETPKSFTVTVVSGPDTSAPQSYSDAKPYYKYPSNPAAIHLYSWDVQSGVQSMYYVLDGGSTQSLPGVGIPPASYLVPVSGDATHTIQFWAKDVAGNVEATKSVSFMIDTLAPVTTCNATSGSDYWGSKTFTLSASDGGSGIDSTYYILDGGSTIEGSSVYVPAPRTVYSTAHTIVYWSVDKAGNVETPKTVSITSHPGDTIPPTTYSNVATTYVNSTIISLNAYDNVGGSGVAATHFVLDSGADTTGTLVFVSTFGPHTLEYWSVDKAGNVELPHNFASFWVGPYLAPTTLCDAQSYYNASQLPANVHLTAYDDTGVGANLANTYYILDGSWGSNAVGSSAGVGGAGTVNSISGVPVAYAAGGNGGCYATATQGSAGTPNTGNGGNGSGGETNAGGAGGSGVVIISYPGSSPSFTVSGGYTQKYVFGGNTVIVFKSSGTMTCSGSMTGASVLLVGAGGGGGARHGGGGGAGGYVTGTVNLSGTVTVTVGAGGAGATSGSTSGSPAAEDSAQNGQSTTAFGLTAYGGGAGMGSVNGVAGASGGGGGGGSSCPGGNATPGGQGNPGGSGLSGTPWLGGGGGGSGGTLTTSATQVTTITVTTAGTHTLTYWSTDKAGHVEVTKSARFVIDATPPVTTSNAGGAYTGSAQFTLFPTDDLGGSGVANTYWQVGGGATQTGVSVSVPGPGDNSTITRTVYFWSVDNAGNVETTKSATFTIGPLANMTFSNMTPSVNSTITSRNTTVSVSAATTGSVITTAVGMIDGVTKPISLTVVTSGFSVTGVTGGTQSIVGSNTVIVFTSSGSLVCSGSVIGASVLVVGGGGGGSGGGGGAGGVVSGTVNLPGGTTNVTVGSGGAGGSSANPYTSLAGNGGNSSIISLTAIGGGAGGAVNNAGCAAGGSGGGAGDGWGQASGGAGTSGQGNAGGANVGSRLMAWDPSGGGGGAGAVGGNGTTTASGSGGTGVPSSLTGTAVTYGGGGGGGSDNGYPAGSGGTGGGGAGSPSGNGAAGAANTGGGGGGGLANAGAYTGGNGGSGIVIVSFPTPTSAAPTSSFSISAGYSQKYTSGANTIVVFNSSGSLICSGTMTGASVLVVGGGGGGSAGNNFGGGGGAGQVVSATNVTLAGVMSVTVGSGGASSNNGAPSSMAALGLTAAGGSAGSGVTGGTSGSSYAGGAGNNNNPYGGGGGGGSTAAGANVNNRTGGAGGSGTVSSITGSAITYAGGGGAGGADAGGAGTAGGGNGGWNVTGNFNGGNATPNTGSGGGGAVNATGGNGGSGVVIVSYPTSSSAPFSVSGYSQQYTFGSNTVVVFTSSGNLVCSGSLSNASVLVVGGGGGGATNLSGGGGGGGVAATTMNLSGTIPVTVGGGGASNGSYTYEDDSGCSAQEVTVLTSASNGANSSFGTVTAFGGGHGAQRDIYDAPGAGAGVASGGGGATYLTAGGVSTSGQGYSGGNGYPADGYSGGGGGGGAGGAGANGFYEFGGDGGPGAASSISGTLNYYGGGGGGGSYFGHSVGGSGGGGAGEYGYWSTGGVAGTAGTSNTGGGGGAGAAGGSGIVIISYPTPTSSPTTSFSVLPGYSQTYTSGSNTVVVFNSSTSIVCSGSLSNASVLVVGGGGAAGGLGGMPAWSEGGGGAGGVVSGTVNLTGSMTVVVGAGGTGVTPGAGGNGGNSSIGGYTAVGGGGGGGSFGSTAAQGSNGGSGGGGGVWSSGGSAGGSGTGGQGNSGGAGYNSSPSWGAGGGGGATGPGGSGSATAGGAGGAGMSSSISGSLATYAVGGSGGTENATYNDSTVGTPGAANTGNGGNGGINRLAPYPGANGGSGVVIISYPTPTPPPTMTIANASFNATNLSSGLHWASFTFTNAAGQSNTKTWSFNVNVSSDVTAPVTTSDIASGAGYYVPPFSGSSSQSFAFAGSNQTFIVPAGVTSLAVDLYGAQGGGGGLAGLGGRAQALGIPVTPGETLTIRVGGQGADANGLGYDAAGGWPNGGSGSADHSTGSGGGGSTSILRGPTVLVEAGAGGGAGSSAGGAGGTGAASGPNGNGAGANSPDDSSRAGGGGGGWNGGASGSVSTGGSGGTSNIAVGLGTQTAGVQSGNGSAILSWTTGSTPAVGYYRLSATVHLAATDDPGGTGVASTNYSIDGRSTQAGTPPVTTVTPITVEGVHSLRFWSTDNAANVEPANTVNVAIDNTAPHTTTNAAASYLGDATFSLIATDTGSGVSSTYYTLDGAQNPSFSVSGYSQSYTSGSNTIVAFKSSGNLVCSGTMIGASVLVVGGGGGGANGGGGAGGVVSGTMNLSGTIPVTVGSGGTGGSSANPYTSLATAGTNSSIGSLTAIGGGAGGAVNNSGITSGSSGGGAGYCSAVQSGAAGTSGQGNSGGNGFNIPGIWNAAGGGGGAGAIGGTGSATGSGSGGAGVLSSISGSSVWYGGGGGGGAVSAYAAGSGSSGSGGAGSAIGNGAAGVPYTGGGGGGGGAEGAYLGGSGGSGIVIISFPTLSSGVHVGTGNVPSGTSVTIPAAPNGSPISYTVHYWSVDNVGNVENQNTAVIAVAPHDVTPPVTTATVSPIYSAPATITLNATDTGFGVAYTKYRSNLNGMPGVLTTYTAPFSTGSQGAYSLDFWSMDAAGNQEATKTVTYIVDMTPPVTTSNATPTIFIPPVSTQATSAPGFSVTGGYSQKYISGSNTVVVFTSSGTLTCSGSMSNASVLVVGGGGGGGARHGFGGGAGQYVTGTATLSGSMNIVVGAGGTGAYGTQNAVGNDTADTATNGQSSSACGLAAIGGSMGGSSGGGTSGNGYSAGAGYYSSAQNIWHGAGGGGSNGVGGSATASSIGVGGPGTSNSISGSVVTYAAGGAGGGYYENTLGVAGAPNTGNGGGSSGGETNLGTNGGSGIVIISYPTSGSTSTFSVSGYNSMYTSGSNTVVVFTSSGALTCSGSMSNASVLVVGGGGGGGGSSGGGGGGGVVSGTINLSGTMPVVVGGGGSPSYEQDNGYWVDDGCSTYWQPVLVPVLGSNGGNSSLGSLVALGGGLGAQRDIPSYPTSGGSGGGGAGAYQGNWAGAAGTLGQGYAGGNGTNDPSDLAYYAAGGGGGGGGGGVGGAGANQTGGAGGPGLASSISGAVAYYGGGGGGGSYYTPGGGGIGGGGNGDPNGTAGTAGSGGGGGAGAAGGSGIVIISYPTPAAYVPVTYSNFSITSVTGGTQSIVGSNTIVAFTSSGSLVCSGSMTGATVLVVGGGGGGGYSPSGVGGGGGGGGGVVSSAQPLSGTIAVTVGSGGAANAGHGGSSTFGAVTASGGGGGGAASSNGASGSSGGGGGGNASGGGGTSGQGNTGGNGVWANHGGGGGGAGAVGGNSYSPNGGGIGGSGASSAITGSSVLYGGGGGGGYGTSNGGAGGGGSGATASGATAGTNGLGGGGGGGYNGYGGGNGGTGGSGIVIISYPTPGVTYSGGTAQIQLSATDMPAIGLGGSGVKATYYKVDNASSWSSGNTISIQGPVTGSAVHSIAFYSADNADNQESPAKTATFTLTVQPASMTWSSYTPAALSIVNVRNPVISVQGTAAENITAAAATLDGVPVTPALSWGASHTVGTASFPTSNLQDTTHTVTFTFTVASGMQASTQWSFVEAGPDNAPPVTTSDVKSSYAGTATVTLNAVDYFPTGVPSGIKATYYTLDSTAQTTGTVITVGHPLNGAPITHHITFWSVDNAGNVESTSSPANSATFTVAPATDTTAPTTYSNVTSGSVFTGPTSITLWAVDNPGGQGVQYTYYKLDKGAQTAYTTTISLDPPPTASATHTIEYWSVDYAGNIETHTVAPFTINSLADYTPPTTQISYQKYYTAVSTITLSATDNKYGSGVANTKFRQTLNGTPGVLTTYTVGGLPTGGQGHYLLDFWSKDVAGNQENTQTVEYWVDWTAPVTSSNATATYNGPATISLTATDGVNGSGVYYTQYELDGATTWTTGNVINVTDPPVGSAAHYILYRSVDWAGNVETATRKDFTINAVPANIVFSAWTPPQNGTSPVRGVVVSVRGTASTNITNVTATLDGSPVTASRYYNAGQTDCTGQFNATLADGVHIVSFTYTVTSGQQGTTSWSFTVAGPDNAPPVTTSDVQPSYVSTATIHLTAVDYFPGGTPSGVNRTLYQLDGGSWSIGTTIVVLPPVYGYATHTLSYYSVDNAGNSEQAHPPVTFTVNAVPDSVPPNTACNYLPSYTTRAANISLTASDNVGGWGLSYTEWRLDNNATQTSYVPNTSIPTIAGPTTGTATHYLYFRSVDLANNKETVKSVSFTITATPDNTPPTTSISYSQRYSAPSFIYLTASDSGQGVANTYYILTGGTSSGNQVSGTTIYTGLQGSYTLQYWSVDNATNKEATNTVTYIVDQTPPTTTDNHVATYSASAAVVLTANDNPAVSVGGSGINYTSYQIDSGAVKTSLDTTNSLVPWLTTVTVPRSYTSGPPEVHTLTYWSTDKVGWSETHHTISFTINAAPDTTPPSTTTDRQPFYGATPGTIHLTATDAGWGVAYTNYKVDSNTTQTGNAVSTGGSASPGTHSLYYWSTDNANNVESKNSTTYTVDTTAPITSIVATQSAYSGSPSISLTAFDPPLGSGVAVTYYRLDGGAQTQFTAGTPIYVQAPISGTASHSLAFWSVDNMSNTESVKTATFTVTATTDSTPPSISDNHVATYAMPSTFTVTATDGGWGVSTIMYQRDTSPTVTGYSASSGGVSSASCLVGTGGSGPHTLKYWATDGAGNTATNTITYVVTTDTAPPVTTSNYQPVYNNGPATILLTATDVGWGVQYTHYQLNGGVETSGTYIVVQDPVTGSVNSTLTFWSVDWANNVETHHTVTFIVNAVPAAMSFSNISPADGSNIGTTTAAVTITANSNEPLSSAVIVIDGTPHAPTTFTKNGVTATAVYNAMGITSGQHTVVATFTGADGRQNSKSWSFSCTPRTDYTAPITASDAKSMYFGTAVIHLFPADEVGGSGLKFTDYQVDGGTITSATVITIAAPTSGAPVSHTITYWSGDIAGNIETANSKTFTVGVADHTAPLTTSNAALYYNAPPIITLLATDVNGSGVAATYYELDNATTPTVGTMVAGAGGVGTHVLNFWSVDNAGNIEATKTATFIVDERPPVTTCDAAALYKGPATVHLDPQDGSDGSGIRNTYWILDGGTQVPGTSIPVSAPTSGTVTHQIAFWSVDNAGNVESTKTATFNVQALPDTTAPTTSLSFSKVYQVPGIMKLSAVDNDGGWGVADTYYILDSNPMVDTNLATLGLMVPTGGTSPSMHTLRYWSVDNAGNYESAKIATYTVLANDTTPPHTTSDATSTYVGPATISLTATDNSGIAPVTYYQVDSGPVATGTVVNVPGPATGSQSHVLHFWSIDVSGNEELPHNTANFTCKVLPATMTFSGVSPVPGSTIAVRNPSITITALGQKTIASCIFTLDGTVVTPQVTLNGTTASITYSANYLASSLNGVVHNVSATFVDTASGVASDTWQFTVKAPADVAPPTTAANASAAYPGTATITLHSTDETGGSGVAYTYYRIDGGSQVVGTPPTTTISVSDPGPHVLEYWSVDAEANVELPHKSLGFNVDPTPPHTTSDAQLAYDGDAVIHLTPSDNAGGSGLAGTFYIVDASAVQSGTVVTVPAPLAGDQWHNVYFWSVDVAGNVEPTESVSIHVFAPLVSGPMSLVSGTLALPSGTTADSTPPTTVSDAAASYATPGVIDLVATDGSGGSGIAGTYYSLDGAAPVESTVLGTGGLGLHTLSFWSVDVAGNAESPHTLTYVVGSADNIAPTTVSNAVAAYTGTGEILLTATDNPGGSGVAHTYYRYDGGPRVESTLIGVSGSGSHHIDFWSVDAAGNVEAANTVHFNVTMPDTTPPTTTSDALASYVGTATVSLTATDGVEGSGVRATYYRLDSGPVQNATSVTILAPVSGTASHTVEFWSVDSAGNAEAPTTVSFMVSPIPDTVPPTTTSDAAASYAGTATITVAAVDNAGGSGVKATYYQVDASSAAVQTGTTIVIPPPVSGAVTHSIYFWSVDNAGNAEAKHSFDLTVNAQAPAATATLSFQWHPGGYGEADLHVENASGQTVASSGHLAGSGTALYWSVGVPAGQTYRMVCDHFYDDASGSEGGGYSILTNQLNAQDLTHHDPLQAGDTMVWYY